MPEFVFTEAIDSHVDNAAQRLGPAISEPDAVLAVVGGAMAITLAGNLDRGRIDREHHCD
ncbi:MAG: hypothetical protein ACRD3P_09655 [Terriglobales bacterium]